MKRLFARYSVFAAILTMTIAACDGSDTTPNDDTGSGDIRDGDIRDGDIRDGDIRDGDIRDGDIRDGDIRDGDIRDGDIRDGDIRDITMAHGDIRDGDIRDITMAHGDIEAGRQIYDVACASCHGPSGVSELPLCSGTHCGCVSCVDHPTLAARIAVNMPPGGVCEDQCAADVAAYILHEFVNP